MLSVHKIFSSIFLALPPLLKKYKTFENLTFKKLGEKGNLHSQRDYHLIINDNGKAEVLN